MRWATGSLAARLFLLSLGAGCGQTGAQSGAPRSDATPVLGMSWDGTEWQFEVLDPVTGTKDQLAKVSTLKSLSAGMSAIDPAARRIYQIGASDGDSPGVQRIYSLDVESGDVLASPVLDAAIEDIEVDGAGRVLGIARNGTTTELRAIDTATGATTVLSTLPSLDAVVTGSSAVDRDAGRLYEAGSGSDGMGRRIFTIDAKSGAVLASPVMDTPCINIALDPAGKGRLLCVATASDGKQLRALDPATGATSVLGAIPRLDTALQGITALDTQALVLYQIGKAKGDPATRLFGIDVKTGAVVSSPGLGTELFTNMEVAPSGR
jgi:hypothetical protein